TAAAEDSMTKRNRMLIRLDHELKNPLTALRTSAASIREVVRDGGTLAEVEPAAKQVDVSSRRRSEEHTSELQSRFDLVCRLLLARSLSRSALFPYTPLFRSDRRGRGFDDQAQSDAHPPRS